MRYLADALMLALLVLGCRVDDRKSSGTTPIEQGEDVRACFYPDNLEAINDCPAEKRMVQFTLIEVEVSGTASSSTTFSQGLRSS